MSGGPSLPGRERILVVDDDPALLFATAHVLQREGYEVFEAPTGADALVMVARERPALALVDRVLPDMDGMEVCDRIKRDPALQGTVVVLTSGVKTRIADQMDGLSAGADGYLTRPVGNRELAVRVESFLRISRGGMALRQQAEAVVRGQAGSEGGKGPDAGLLHELEVHRIELEMQNRELRQVQRRLEDSRDRYFQLFHRAPVGFATLDDRARVRAANLTVAEMLAVEPERLVGASLADHVAPGDRDVFLGRFRAFFRDPKGKSFQLRMLRSDGRELHVTLNGAGLRLRHAEAALDEPAQVVPIALTDVTQLVTTEQALRASQARLVQAQRVARVGDFWWAADTGLGGWSEVLCELLGRPMPAIADLTRTEGGVCHPDDVPRLRAWLEEGLASGRDELAPLEVRLGTAQGQVLHARVLARIERPGGGQTRVYGTIQDVSERRELEGRLLQADRLASLGLLAAGVAHEINNPLTYLLASIDSAGDGLRALLPPHEVGATPPGRGAGPALAGLEELAAHFAAAREGAVRIRDVARGLATFARTDRAQAAQVDLAQVLESAARLAGNEIRFRARLVKDLAPVPPVLGSEGQLTQVFLNLLINSAHAVGEGDVERQEIRLRTWTEGDQVLAEVQDSGGGIRPEHLARVFEPLFTTKDSGRGSGLGLTISKGIVDQHGGTISIESEFGRGTRVKIRLPADRSAPPRGAPVLQATTGAAQRARVLVIDDEAPIRGAVRRMLRPHEVLDAADGEAAKRLLAQDSDFDVVLCDLMMPGCSGPEFHAWASVELPWLVERLVFMSGGAFTSEAQGFLARVGNPCVEKPFDRAELLRVVEDRVRARRAAGGPAT